MKNRIDNIHKRIAEACRLSCRLASDVHLIAVSKRKPLQAIEEAIGCGLLLFGENYIQEAEEKITALNNPSVKWHFIGHLQSNKAKFAVKLFDLIHTVDSLKLAKEIDKQAGKIGKTQKILIQVNIGAENSKAGISPEKAIDLAKDISTLKNISVQGLMTIPPPVADGFMAAPFFAQLKKISLAIQGENIENISMNELSMGMTGDFETAIAEGATFIRVGTAIFGDRS
jgi:hypothetical protein